MSTEPSGADVPVLFLHGFMGRGTDWHPILEQLPGHHALTPDLPGHGASVALPDGAYTMDAAADALVALLDEQPIETAVVVGYSMGGRLALHLAVRHPGRVAGLVLVSASPGLPTNEERAARRALDAERAASIQADLSVFLARWYRMPLFASLDDRTRTALITRRAENDPAELARSLAGMGTGAQPSHWEQLHALRVPTHALVGAHDPKFLSIAQAMAQDGPISVRVLPEAGHALIEEAPDALAEALHTILNLVP